MYNSESMKTFEMRDTYLKVFTQEYPNFNKRDRNGDKEGKRAREKQPILK